MVRRHPRCGAGGAGSGGVLEIGGDTAGVGRRGGEDEADSRGPLDRETRGRWGGKALEIHHQNGKRSSANTPPTHGLAGAARL
jgi:hypothetical protein